MTICIAGKNKIAIEGFRFLLQNIPAHTILACINRTDDGVNRWQPSFKAFCIRNNVKICEIEELYEIDDLILISLEYDRILVPEKFKSKNVFNIHFSNLPAYKGMYTSIWPLWNAEEEAGVTLHKIDNGIDTGAIIDKIIFPVSHDLTAKELYENYLHHAEILFRKNIENLIKGQFVSIPQTADNSSYYAKSTIDFSNIQINLKQTAFQIHNQCRAFTFRDYQLPIIFNKKIYKTEITQLPSRGKPGTLSFVDDSKFIVSTIDFDIKLFVDRENDLMGAAESGDVQTYLAIKESGYPVTIRSKEGWNILIVAAYNNQHKFVEMLVDDSWNVNSKNYKGTTTLMYAMTAAVQGRGFESLSILLGKADTKAKDDMNMDVFEYAKNYSNADVIEFLKRWH